MHSQGPWAAATQPQQPQQQYPQGPQAPQGPQGPQGQPIQQLAEKAPAKELGPTSMVVVGFLLPTIIVGGGYALLHTLFPKELPTAVDPGVYAMEVPGGGVVQCLIDAPNQPAPVICDGTDMEWSLSSGENALAISFDPVVVQGMEQLPNVTAAPELLDSDKIYATETDTGTLTVDTTGADRITFTLNGEGAWISRTSFGTGAQ